MLHELSRYIGPLLAGTWVTVQLTVLSIVLSVVVAFTFGLMQFSRSRALNWIARIYVDFFRGTSALVLLYWLYFALPFLGLSLTAMQAGILGIGLSIGAYLAEVVRGCIVAVPKDQYEAATALNFTRRQTMARIILPQAIIRMIPPFGNLFIQLLKATALVSLITINDLTFQAQLLRSVTYKTAVIFLMVLIIYFILAQLISAGMKALERHFSFGQDYGGAQL